MLRVRHCAKFFTFIGSLGTDYYHSYFTYEKKEKTLKRHETGEQKSRGGNEGSSGH